jgi:hypothetical protein
MAVILAIQEEGDRSLSTAWQITLRLCLKNNLFFFFLKEKQKQ